MVRTHTVVVVALLLVLLLCVHNVDAKRKFKSKKGRQGQKEPEKLQIGVTVGDHVATLSFVVFNMPQLDFCALMLHLD